MPDTRKDPVGAWEWVKGPSWWRDCPTLIKAAASLVVAFTAGMAAYAAFATQLAIPALLGQHGVRLDTLEVHVASIEARVIPMVEADHAMLQRHRLQLDSLRVTLDGVWCIMRAKTHNLDPLRECFVPRPTRNGNGDDSDGDNGG
jgi:hypothetical protein